MPTLWDLNEGMDKGLAHSEHSITGSQDESGLKLMSDFRDMIEMLSTAAELVCAVDTPDLSSETDPWAILHIVTLVLLLEYKRDHATSCLKCCESDLKSSP